MTESGNKIRKTDQELSSKQMAKSILVSSKMTEKKVKGKWFSQMETISKGCLLRIKKKEKDYYLILMEIDLKVNGKMTK
jgi:hypothetical protein